MIAAGSSAMGLRRSILIAAAMLLVLSVGSVDARRSFRLVALGVGVVLGAPQGYLFATQIYNTPSVEGDLQAVYLTNVDV